MARIVTFNANGIRSATTKGFWNWFDSIGADVLCVQELKAQLPDLPPELTARPGWHAHLHCARKRGYSGCGVWSRRAPAAVALGFGDEEFDAEGRYVRCDFEDFSVVSVYFPSGTSGDERQQAKYRFLARFQEHMDRLRERGLPVVVCGDMNIAHKEIDLKNWKGNLDHSGFLPEERQWMTDCLGEHGWCDVFRRLDPRPEQYTWWSQRGQARAKNVGWRIDYQLAACGMEESARSTFIYKDEKFSDHAPLVIDYDA
ncbi:MAG: exodeoxyribonuclease III [Duodenibacillus sp.]|nr:exodeoxyribonuclease III [Duodenibacillus sp.]